MAKILTCVYCGMQYPEGTPPHGAKVLTDHIKICEKHPMRKVEERSKKLKDALMQLVAPDGATKEELKGMKALFQSASGNNEIDACRKAIDVLLDVIEEEEATIDHD